MDRGKYYRKNIKEREREANRLKINEKVKKITPDPKTIPHNINNKNIIKIWWGREGVGEGKEFSRTRRERGREKADAISALDAISVGRKYRID